MAFEYMIRSRMDDNNGGGWWHTTVTVSGGVSSDYILPVQPILALGAKVTGSGTLAFTLDSAQNIEAGTASYENWDGIAQINLAATGFHFTCASGSATALVGVKTFYAS